MKIDKKLVRQLQKGDANAQHQFWGFYFKPILTICSRVLGAGPTAVDVTTDLLNDFMFRYVNDLSRPDGAWSYLKLMAIRRAVREKQRAMKKETFDNQVVVLDDSDFSKEEIVVMLPQLEKCLGELTPKAQSIVRLKYTKGVSNAQIGNVVGGSKQYIGRVIQKSLAALKDCMEQQEVAHE